MRACISWALAVLFLSASPALVRGEESSGGAFTKTIVPFLSMYCTGCHGSDAPEAELALDEYQDLDAVAADRKRWDTVLTMLRTRQMPPEGEFRPSEQEYADIVKLLEAELANIDCSKLMHPGRVTLRRLNRAEYNNTIRDLLGVSARPADTFPSDDVGNGFDNIGDVLSLSPILLEKYLAAATEVLDEAFAQPDLRDRILVARPRDGVSEDDAGREVLRRFLLRAYRRPATDDEVNRLLELARMARKDGANFEQQMHLALQAVLTSPHFLFRVEKDPDDPAGIRELDDYELATRLSYFLWSSMPDEELFELAGEDRLSDPETLEAQVHRMLKDPKSQALVDNFAAQWLQLRDLSLMAPDPERFPDFDESLRESMRIETEKFFEFVMREDRSILEFLDSDYTFVNERLARHYGIEGIEGEEFQRVRLSGNRGGVLTHGSILLLTSNPTRTSPVKRGKWILSNILGTPPLPPPPGVEELDEDEAAELVGSLRERMEQHRADPVCASCHTVMDQLGFGFENFDAIGAWRTSDGRFPVDSSGTLPGNVTFNGPAELRRILRETEGQQFCRCFAEKMLTYALGRGLENYDRCTIDQIVEHAARSDFRFSSIVMAIVTSEPFRKRSGMGGMP